MTRRLLLLLSFVSFAVAQAEETPAAGASASGDISAISKKDKFLAEKTTRRDVHRARLPKGSREATIPVSLRNIWTREVLPVDPDRPPGQPLVNDFLRCHFTNQATPMDPRLIRVVIGAARFYKSRYVEVVSGFRAPKYNLMLRKKGHEVARESQHPLGHAVDFRLAGVPTKRLLEFVRAQGLGGVGYYPRSSFVHADVGPVRFWTAR